MTDLLKKAIVRIKNKNGRVVGAGFLTGDSKILTCAHVIKSALGINKAQPDKPESDIHLDFAFAPDRKTLTARVVFWSPTVKDGGYDIAGLKLTGYPPPAARPAPLDLQTASPEPLHGINYEAYGFPKNLDQGIWSEGKVIGERSDGFVQLEDQKLTGEPIEGGFSGGAVWDKQAGRVIGIVRTAFKPDTKKIAFMIPLYKVLELWPELKSTQVATSISPIKRIIIGFCLALIILLTGLYFYGLLHFHGNQANEYLKSANIFLNQGMYTETLEQYEHVLQICENCPKVLPIKRKAEFFKEIAEGEYNPGKMIERLKNIAGVPEDDPHVLLLLGNMSARMSKAEEAEKHYLTATEKEPNLAEAWFSLGVLYHKQGKVTDALKMFQEAARIAESNFKYLDNLAWIYFETEQYDEAIKRYQQMLNADADFLLAYLEIAKTLLMNKNPDTALDYYRILAEKITNNKIADKSVNTGPWYFPANGESVILDNLDAKKYYAWFSLAATSFLFGSTSETETYMKKAGALSIGAVEAHNIRFLVGSDITKIGKINNVKEQAEEFRSRFFIAP
ncbi:tetratricopeptide repeat-containing serine protease family protein [Desulfococcaceae bacterium HSG7]|nr:tetratricopeptide repeat-containing serine protease family protein [Desulfococcaceae bacterium HSG7]